MVSLRTHFNAVRMCKCVYTTTWLPVGKMFRSPKRARDNVLQLLSEDYFYFDDVVDLIDPHDCDYIGFRVGKMMSLAHPFVGINDFFIFFLYF